MTYVVTVAVTLPEGAPQLDALQREGVIHLLRGGFDSLEAIEGPDGMEVDLMDDVIAAHPGGALLKLFVDAPALEFAEEAAREVVAELLEQTEPLAGWLIARCAVELNSELLQESLDAADGPDAPPADPAERARRHEAAKLAAPAQDPGPRPSEAEAMRARLRELAPALAASPLASFGYDEDPQERIVGKEAAEIAAGALVYAIDLLVDELFTDLAGLEEDGPTVADSNAAFMILEDLPPHLAHEYTVLFTRRLMVTAITLTARLTQPAPFHPTCTAEELLLRSLLTQAEVTADLYGLLTEEVSTALELFAESAYGSEALAAYAREPDEFPDLPEEPAESPRAESVDTWFTPFTPADLVHPYAANEEEGEGDGDDHSEGEGEGEGEGGGDGQEEDGGAEGDEPGAGDGKRRSVRRKPDR
ncbi:hypothetical protein ACIPRD_01915 [Streptomyces sp. NPDC090108]|uniref:hypothetical protein n=1 Tax=Streptomyces sp. NPDC090108 TaxID=3365947 RepID=UPI003815B812